MSMSIHPSDAARVLPSYSGYYAGLMITLTLWSQVQTFRGGIYLPLAELAELEIAIPTYINNCFSLLFRLQRLRFPRQSTVAC